MNVAARVKNLFCIQLSGSNIEVLIEKKKGKNPTLWFDDPDAKKDKHVKITNITKQDKKDLLKLIKKLKPKA